MKMHRVVHAVGVCVCGAGALAAGRMWWGVDGGREIPRALSVVGT